jgi:hypothetical protein
MVSWPGSIAQAAIRVEANSYQEKISKKLRVKRGFFYFHNLLSVKALLVKAVIPINISTDGSLIGCKNVKLANHLQRIR